MEQPAPSWNDGEGRRLLDHELAKAGVPAKYRHADPSRVRARKPLDDYTDNIVDHVAACEGLLITGPTGTGKSSVAALICTAAIKAGLSTRYVYVPDLLESLSDVGGRRDEAFRRQLTPQLLVWDDFGVGGLAEWQIGKLDRVVEHRYQRSHPMVVVTNLTADALRADALLQRMVDRWREGGHHMHITGESMRVYR